MSINIRFEPRIDRVTRKKYLQQATPYFDPHDNSFTDLKIAVARACRNCKNLTDCGPSMVLRPSGLSSTNKLLVNGEVAGTDVCPVYTTGVNVTKTRFSDRAGLLNSVARRQGEVYFIKPRQ